MTGTSLDGIDAALVEVTGAGLDMTARFAGMVHKPFGGLRDHLLAMAEGRAVRPVEIVRAARHLGRIHAEAVGELCHHHLPDGARLDFVAAHGQTILHAPDEHLSWQLFDPWPIVHKVRAPVCYDLRQADLIAGGQGAPLTPIADWVLYRDPDRYRRVVNLGGVCNVTEVPPGCDPEVVRGEDIGPCNLLIDGVVRTFFPDLPYDRDGEIGSRGAGLGALYDAILDADFFRRPRPRSTGREDFDSAWVRNLVEWLDATPHDAIASAVDAVARLVADSTPKPKAPLELILGGGGAHNPLLVRMIRERSDGCHRVRTSDELGIPCEAREAIAFAVLGALSRDRVAISLPHVTGAARPGLAGAWVYPAD